MYLVFRLGAADERVEVVEHRLGGVLGGRLSIGVGVGSLALLRLATESALFLGVVLPVGAGEECAAEAGGLAWLVGAEDAAEGASASRSSGLVW